MEIKTESVPLILNGNKVNGKIASFTDEERRQFREALQDLSKKMTAVAMTL